MNSRTFAALLTLAALAVAACGGSQNNANTTNANAVVVNRPANSAVSVNANANTNSAVNGNISRADYDREKARYEDEARRSGRTIGTGVNDGWLWTKVRAQLMTADDLRDSTIDVDVDKEVVTLSGTVANGNQKVRAADIATKTEGVKSVKNNLTIRASGGNSNAGAANTSPRR